MIDVAALFLVIGLLALGFGLKVVASNRPPKDPFNFINGVFLPLPTDPRWEYTVGGDCDLPVARIHIDYFHDNDYGNNFYTLYVDGMSWKDSSGYCARVHEQVKKDFLARRIRDGAEIVRNTVSQVGS